MLEFLLMLVAVDYARDVHPVLAAKCFSCHSGEKRFAGLSVATHADLLKGGKSGRVVDPGSSASSLLYRRVTADGMPVMPPAGPPLTENEIAAIRSWIDDGARMQEGGEKAKAAWAAPLALTRPAAPSADAILAAYWKANGVTPPAPVSDAVFARRVYLDLWGLLPTPQQLDAFLADRDPGKRAALIRSLLAHNRNYAEHWITFWNDHLRNDEGVNYIGTRKSITDWLLKALESNLPYDAFSRALLNPVEPTDPDGFLAGVNWRGDVNASQTPTMQAAQNSAQLFLGVNLKCNSCHDSFINKWKLADAYGLASFFSDEPLELIRCDARTGRWSEPKFLYPELGGVSPDACLSDKRKAAARLFTARENGRFARTFANRIWKRLIGRGIVEPADDMDAEPWSPDLLDWLASDFVENGYDIKHLITRIMTSPAYALPAVPPSDVFRGPAPRRLSAEQFLDAISSITGEWRPRVTASGKTAEQSRDWRLPNSPLARALGRPVRDQLFTERNEEATTLQALELVNGDAYTKFLQRASRRMLGLIPPPPKNLFDSGRVSSGPVKVDIDLTGVRELRLLVVDVDSYSPERVSPVWADAHWTKGSRKIALDPKAKPIRMKGARFRNGIRTGGLGDGPVEIVYDIAGKGYTRFRASVGVEESTLASDISPRIRFFLFAEKPDMDRLVALDPHTPVDAPPGPWTPDSLADRVFHHALGRAPNAKERQVARSFLDPAGSGEIRPSGLADLLWSITALPEFRLL